MTKNANEDKYKFLCEYQKIQFEDEKSQYFKLEDKSSKYLSFLNLFIPLYSFCFSYYLKGLVENCSLIVIFLFFIFTLSILTFISAWSFIFRSLKLMSIPKMPSDQELMKVYYKYSLEEIYLYTADRYRQAIDVYKEVNNQKIDLINIAYKEITFGSFCFMLSVLLIIIIKVYI